jgi:hypothetical protein
MRSAAQLVATVAAIAWIAACGRDEPAAPAPPPPQVAVPAETPPPPPGLPPTAKLPMVDELRRDLAQQRSPADGGGRAWFTPGPRARVVAQTPNRLTIVYETGPQGIAPGGSILLLTPKWWYWSAPQCQREKAPGYVTASTRAEGVDLVLHDVVKPATNSFDVGGVSIEVRGRSLRAGERVEIVYGAGELLAQVDAFAERNEHLWLEVDGDGDGVRGLVVDSPVVDVDAGPPSQLVAILPTTAHVGDTVLLRVTLLDVRGNWTTARDEVALEADAGLEVPPEAVLHDGHADVSVAVRAPGVLRVHAKAKSGYAAEANPLVVLPQTPRVLWGDLHGHSNFSDGSGTPEDYFRYARDVAGLDVSVLTDHDHVGRRMLDASPDLWKTIRDTVERFHAPGRFVTLLGFEWTSWIYGHRHVLYFGPDGEVISTADPAHETPQELWSALRGKPALTFTHHSAGGPIATDWSIPPDPELEPIAEITSVHGSSEAEDTPRKIYAPVAGNFVRDVLQRGYRLGFVGSGDTHDGHPGFAQLANSGSGGLAGILSEDLTRESVYAALRARRVYATNGPRIFLGVTLAGAPMGSAVSAAANPTARLAVLAIGESGFDRVDVIRGPNVAESVPGERRLRIGFSEDLRDLRPGEAIYVRAVQADGGAAWSSPFFVE